MFDRKKLFLMLTVAATLAVGGCSTDEFFTGLESVLVGMSEVDLSNGTSGSSTWPASPAVMDSRPARRTTGSHGSGNASSDDWCYGCNSGSGVCTLCNGSGRFVSRDCMSCGGTGRCRTCGGTGRSPF